MFFALSVASFVQVLYPSVSSDCTRDPPPHPRARRRTWARALLACALLLVPAMSQAQPTTPPPTRWFLAEGAANGFFPEDTLIGNPTAAAVNVQITLLPQSDSGQPGTPIVVSGIQVQGTSRYTFHVNNVANLTSGSVSAVVECIS